LEFNILLSGAAMERTVLASALILTLLFSMVAGTLFFDVRDVKDPCSHPFSYFDASIISSSTSDNDVETISPELSPEELWNFTVANLTANTLSLSWWEPEVANGIAYLCNTETYTIPDEPHLYSFGTPLPHTLGTTYAINLTSGKELWNLTGAGSFRSLSIIDAVAYMSTSDSTVFNGQSEGASFYALDAVNGTQKWSRHYDGDSRWSKINNDMLYIYFLAPNSPSYVCAVNMNNGSELWRWKADYNDMLSLATVGDGAIYFGSYDSKDNHYYAVNATNGIELWRIPVEGRVPGIPIFDDGVVYFNSDEASYALNAQNGEQLSDASMGNIFGNYSIDEMTSWSIGRTEGLVYINSLNGTLSVLSTVNGMQIWSHNTGVIGYGSSTISEGVFYYYLNNTFHALEASNGNSLWNYTRSNQSFLTVANRTAFFAAGNTVYALNVPSAVNPSSPEPQPDAFLTTLIIAAGASATIVGLGVLLYFKKRNGGRNPRKEQH
jgi:outer membrane protein assembly factor BamB